MQWVVCLTSGQLSCVVFSIPVHGFISLTFFNSPTLTVTSRYFPYSILQNGVPLDNSLTP